MSDKLTDKQRIFCEEYVIDWNATRAAKAAGYSEKTSHAIGQENLKKPIVAAYVEEIQKDLQKLAQVSALSNIQVLQEIMASKEDDVAPRDRIKAVEVINKMLGFNAPEKTDITTNGKGIAPIKWVDDSTD